MLCSSFIKIVVATSVVTILLFTAAALLVASVENQFRVRKSSSTISWWTKLRENFFAGLGV